MDIIFAFCHGDNSTTDGLALQHAIATAIDTLMAGQAKYILERCSINPQENTQ
jgi:hypothetical protein